MNRPLIVCVGIDMSDASRVAVRQALQLMDGHGGELHMISVVNRTDDASNDFAALSRELEDAIAELKPFADSVVGPSAAVHVRLHARVGKPAVVIHQLAVDYDADLIVVGEHSRVGIERWLLGSVAEELVRIAHCPVFIAKTRDFANIPKTPRLGEMPAESAELHRSQVHNNTVRPVERSSHISGLL